MSGADNSSSCGGVDLFTKADGRLNETEENSVKQFTNDSVSIRKFTNSGLNITTHIGAVARDRIG